MRFYESDSGRITLDGVDTRSMTREALRSQIGMVLQDTWLFGGTIADHLRYGAEDASDEAMLAAAHATHVDRFVRTLPDGYATRLDDEGSHVSAGAKQLLTIARALRGDPARRAHVVRHRPSALHHPRRRRHPRHGARVDRGARHPHGAPGRRRRLRPALREPVRGGLERVGGTSGAERIAPCRSTA